MSESTIKDLYDLDYHLWLMKTSKLLKAQDFVNIDLKNLLQDKIALTKAYQRGRRDAIRKTEIENLPQNCPYSIEQALDNNFFPENYNWLKINLR